MQLQFRTVTAFNETWAESVGAWLTASELPRVASFYCTAPAGTKLLVADDAPGTACASSSSVGGDHVAQLYLSEYDDVSA